MRIHVEGNIYITSDKHNFIVEEETMKQDGSGKGKTVVHGYFSSLSSVAKFLVKMKVKQSTATTLQELVRDMKRIEEQINTTLNV